MRLLHFEDVGLILPGRPLFEHVTWSVFRGERYGLVGVNGAGKTTLLRMVVGVVEPTEGELQRVRGLTTGYLQQEGIAHRGRPLFEEAWSGLPDLPHLQQEISATRERLAADHENLDLIEYLGALEHRWQDLEGYHAEAKVSRVLAGLGFKESDYQRPVEEFSGGWQMRVALAKLLLFDPDILLLDEPTNHLDLPALMWLEDYLSKYSGSLIIVSHDRRFLDRAVDRIAEIDRGRLTVYKGNYSQYEVEKQERYEQELARAGKISDERERMEAFVKRFRYKASKAKQVQSRVKMLEKLEEVDVLRPSTKSVHFRFPPAPPSGRIVLEIRNLQKRYGSLEVFHDVDVVLTRGEKVALVGVNGAGKSTLCRLIVQAEEPTRGELKLGHGVQVDYFAQEADSRLHENNTVLAEMESVVGLAAQTWLRSLLGAFLFSGEDVFKPISVLSGGERARLSLAKMLLRPSNFIILDEPTNHLDMASQNVLLEALKSFEGTLLVVSHDRYFLDRLVDRVIELDSGELRDWPGNLSEYLEKKQFGTARDGASNMPDERLPVGTPSSDGFKSKEQKRLEAEVRNKVSGAMRAARNEVDTLQQKIDRHESRKKELESILSDEGLYREVDKYKAAMAEYDAIRRDLPGLLTAWEAAAEKLDVLEQQRDEMLKNQG